MLTNVDNANVKNNDMSNVKGDYNRTTFNLNVNHGPGNSESFTPKFLDLIPRDYKTKHQSVKSSIRRHPTAGKWLLGKEAYNTWKSGKSSKRLLWLNGIPGVGKTVICSHVIDNLSKEDHYPVVFFYCHDTHTRCNSRSILESLLQQLLDCPSPDSPKFIPIMKKFNETRLNDVDDHMLIELLREISILYGKTFIVIDALDECSNLEAMLREFVTLAEELYIFISSRDHAAIRMKFERYEQIRISEDDIAKDIRQYVTEEVADIKVGREKLCKSITRKLVMGAQGSFLWPVYKVQQLRGAKTDNEREDILTTIPQGMQSVIVKLLDTINFKKNSEILRSALQLVLCMPRPITVQAFSEVMGIIEKEDIYNPDLKSKDPRGLVDDFAGLLICVSGKERNRYRACWSEEFSFDHDFGDDDIVVPFHLCVKKYLLANPVMLPSSLKKYSLYPPSANHDDIMRISLMYRKVVLKNARDLELDLTHHPFAEYARDWLSHTLASGEDDDSQKHGIVVSKKHFPIVIVLILLTSYIFPLTRPCGLPFFLSLGHDQLGSAWEQTVSCKVVSDRLRWFGLFGEPVPIIHCTPSSVVNSQIERKFIELFRTWEKHNVPRLADEITGRLRNKKKDIATDIAMASCNPLPSPSDIVKENRRTGNETGNPAEIENKLTDMFQYWVEHSGSNLVDEIASKIRTEASKQVATSLKPPPPPPDTVPGFNAWLDKPRPTTIDEYLRVFEVVFVVDNSKSMRGVQWTRTRDALATVAEKAFALNIGTVSLRFLDDANYFRGLKGKNNLTLLFDTVKPEGPWRPLGKALKAVFEEHLNRIDFAVGKGEDEYSKILPLDIIVLTDGMPTDKGEDEPRKVVAKAVKRLYDSHYHPNTMSVQIVQIANEETAKQVFRDLVVGNDGRIVDTRPYRGVMDSQKLLRILLEGVHPNIRSQLPVAMLAVELAFEQLELEDEERYSH